MRPVRDPTRLPRRAPCPIARPAHALSIALLALSAPIAGCGPDSTEATVELTREEFIAVMVELRQAEADLVEEDSAAARFAVRKAEILERHGTTEDDLRAWTRAASSDVRALSGTWEEISARLRRPVAPDTVASTPPDSLPLPGPLPLRLDETAVPPDSTPR